MTEWWTSQHAGLVGGIGGSVVGGLGGLLGTLMGVLAPRGKAKAFVLAFQTGLVAAGVLVFVAGMVALVSKQPYHVYYPLILGGGILAFVTGGLLPLTIGVYRNAERRRLEAEEIRRS